MVRSNPAAKVLVLIPLGRNPDKTPINVDVQEEGVHCSISRGAAGKCVLKSFFIVFFSHCGVVRQSREGPSKRRCCC